MILCDGKAEEQQGMDRKVERVEWIDVLKWLGIVAIFCGHLGRETGGLYEFVFSYHVPLFFFVSGIFAWYAKDVSFLDVVKKKFRQIVVPYVFIVMITFLFILLTTQENFWTYLVYGKQFVWGIRNQMYASSLWFFSCLFVMSILFDIVRRLLRYDGLVFIAACALYIVSVTLFPNNPGQQPSWIFNIDSACHYMIYYALGYILRDVLLKERVQTSCKGTWIRMLLGCFLAVYAFLIYIGQDYFWEILQHVPGANLVYPVFKAVLLILFHMVLAKILVPAGRIGYYGSQTLWLCANEFIVKKILTALAALLGFEITVQSALTAVVYAVIMVVVIMEVLLPVEKKVYNKYLYGIDKLIPGINFMPENKVDKQHEA